MKGLKQFTMKNQEETNSNSKIQILPKGSAIYITVPNGESDGIDQIMGFFIIVFLYVSIDGFADIFNVINLIKIVLSGYFLYRIYRRALPEKLILTKDTLTIDTGMPPLNTGKSLFNPNYYLKTMYARRNIIKLNKEEIKTIKLRQSFDFKLRLTAEKNSRIYEFASFVSDAEKKRLFKY